MVCHASFSITELDRNIFAQDKDGQGRPLVFVGHGYGCLVLKQVLVELHAQLDLFKDLQSNLCGIVFYGGTNTKFTIKHHLMLMKNKSWSGRFSRNFQTILDSLMLKSLKDPFLELSKHFEAALDLKKVKVCVVNKNKSFLQVCIFLSILQLVAYDMMCILQDQYMLMQRNLDVGEWTMFQISPSLAFPHKLGGHTNWLGGPLLEGVALYLI